MPIPARLIQKQRIAQNAVSALATKTVTQAVPDLSKLSQAEAGGVLRTVATGTLGTIGNVATTVGVESYREFSQWAVAENIAKDTFTPSRLDNLVDSVSRAVDPVVGNAMAKFSQGMFVDAAIALTAGVSREVTNFYRETVAVNSHRDPRVVSYQRITSANACAFCLYIATQTENTSWANDSGYHDHCGCSSAPVFKGDEPYQADYLSEFDDEVGVAMREIRDLGDELRPIRVSMKDREFFALHPEAAMNTENILARIRASSGRS